MKPESNSLILALLVGSSTFALAPGAYAQLGEPVPPPAEASTPWNPLPANLRKGVNLGGAYGNALGLWSVPPNGIDSFGNATGIGHDTTNPARLNALFTANDFLVMKQGVSSNPGYPFTQYFDHVIFNLDPHTFGADPLTAAVPATGGTVDGHSLDAIFDALAADIDEADGAGLAVVLAMHATSQSVTSAYYFQADTQARLRSNPGDPPARLFPGPHKVDLYTRGRPGNTHNINLNHPLPKFWSTFLARLNNHITHWDQVQAFRVGGEALTFSRESFRIADAPVIPGHSWDEEDYEPRPNMIRQRVTEDHFRKWINHARKDYRQIELMAVRAIWSNPTFQNKRILVGPGDPWPESYDYGWPLEQIGNWAGNSTYRYTPYGFNDFYAAGFPSLECNRYLNLIYTVHQYSPFRYTHPFQAQKWDIDYSGQGDGDQRGWLGPPTSPLWVEWQDGQNGEGDRYPNFVLRTLTPTTHAPAGSTPFQPWWIRHNSPPIMVTEFGVSDRGYRPPFGSNDLGGIFGRGGGESDPQIDPVKLGLHDLMRARWHWDIRTWFQNRGIGWTVWDAWSGWNTFTGDLQVKTGPGQWNLNPPSRYQPFSGSLAGRVQEPNYPQFYPYMHKALFSGTRP